MKALRSAMDVVHDARRPYLVINLAYFGLVVFALVFATFHPSWNEALMGAVGESLSEGPLATVWDAYASERIVVATALTAGINLTVGSFATITLPSLMVPFSGLLMAAFRALTWGVLFSPQGVTGIGPPGLAAGLAIAVLVFLEGEAYVLAALGAFLHGRAFLRPRSVGAQHYAQGYWEGLKIQARIYVLVALAVLVAAVYEVAIAVFAIPALLGP